jgi:hypothetical protein
MRAIITGQSNRHTIDATNIRTLDRNYKKKKLVLLDEPTKPPYLASKHQPVPETPANAEDQPRKRITQTSREHARYTRRMHEQTEPV